MTDTNLRETYLHWFRRAAAVLVMPLALTALVQLAMTSPGWATAPATAGSARYLFYAVAVAGVVVGRNVRDRDASARPLSPEALVSLSWRLLVYALAPVAIGAALVFMTRHAWDFYVLLGATLIGLAVLFPRYDQWVAWSVAAAEEPGGESGSGDGDA